MGTVALYEVQERTSLDQLTQTTASWYHEFLIENYTGAMIYLMMPDGTQYDVPPRYSSAFVDRVEIKSLWKQGNQSPDVGSVRNYSISAQKFPMHAISLSAGLLESDAIYIKELGIAIATPPHRDRLGYVHRLNSDFVGKAVEQLYTQFFTEGWPVPCVIDINSYDTKHQFIYVGVNGQLCSIHVRNNMNEAERMNISYNLAGTHRTFFNVDFDIRRDRVKILDDVGDAVFIIGTDRAEVAKLIESRDVRKGNFYTSEELKIRLREVEEEISTKFADVQKENDQLKKELASVKKDLQLSQLELDKANNEMKMSVEQQMQMIRLTNAIKDQETVQERREMLREQMHMKGTTEYAIAAAKVQKEEISLREAEVSNFGTLAKTASVILPIAASIGLWLSRQSASSACPLIGVAASAAAFLPAVVTGAVSLLTHTANTIWSSAKKVWRRLWD